MSPFMISPSPKNAPVLLGVTSLLPLGAVATVCLVAAVSPLYAVLNVLVLLMTGMILMVWRKVGGLSDGAAWFEVGGIVALECAICIWCVLARA